MLSKEFEEKSYSPHRLFPKKPQCKSVSSIKTGTNLTINQFGSSSIYANTNYNLANRNDSNLNHRNPTSSIVSGCNNNGVVV